MGCVYLRLRDQMAEGNYDEGAERVALAGAARQNNQTQLRKDQANRLKWKVIGALVCVGAVSIVLLGLHLTGLGQEKALRLMMQADQLYKKQQYQEAIFRSDEALEYGHFQWDIHAIKAMSYLELEAYGKAAKEMDYAIGYHKDSWKMSIKYRMLRMLSTNKVDSEHDPGLDQFSNNLWHHLSVKFKQLTEEERRSVLVEARRVIIQKLFATIDANNFCFNITLPKPKGYGVAKVKRCIDKQVLEKLVVWRGGL